MKHTHKIFF